jgi:hypothetical protein
MLRPSTRNPAIGAEKNGNLIRAEGVLGCLAKGNSRIDGYSCLWAIGRVFQSQSFTIPDGGLRGQPKDTA